MSVVGYVVHGVRCRDWLLVLSRDDLGSLSTFIFFERLGLIVCACWYLLASSMFSSTSMSSFVISFVSLDCSRFFPNLSLERLCSVC